jgi:hypothetical protein
LGTDGGQHYEIRRNGTGRDVSTLRNGGTERALTVDSALRVESTERRSGADTDGEQHSEARSNG